jgi:hypothetical protein
LRSWRRRRSSVGVVELAYGLEARAERDLRERQVRRLDERAGGLGALGPGECERPGTHLRDELAVQVALAVAEALGEPADAFPVDDTVRDEAHGPSDEVGPAVPLGRAGGCVGPATLAGAEPGTLRGRRGRVESHVAGLRRHGRTAGPAVDVRRGDGREEPPVEAGVLALHRPVAAFDVELHVAMLAAVGAGC